MKVIFSNDCLLHDPPYETLSGKRVPYLESPTRYLTIKQELTRRGKVSSESNAFELIEADPHQDVDEYILSVHSKVYIDYLRNAYEEWIHDGGDRDAVVPDTFPHPKLMPQIQSSDVSQMSPIAKSGKGITYYTPHPNGLYCFDLSTPITSLTYTAAVAAVRVTLTASRLLQEQVSHTKDSTESTEGQGVFALTRPPGHHAGQSLSGGYCFFNNVAVAARFLQSRAHMNRNKSDGASLLPELIRVAILDVDYHHGNGTQEIFYEDPSVFYVSLHAAQDYPYYTGTASEIGTGSGKGYNLNIPLPRRTTGDSEYTKALRGAVQKIGEFSPQYVIVSLGLDTFKDDPICEFNITTQGYSIIGKIIGEVQCPTLFVMEGGYDIPTLGINVCSVLEGFMQCRGYQR